MSSHVESDHPLVIELAMDRILENFISENPIEYQRYKSVISKEYFFIIMSSSLYTHDEKIDMLEKLLDKWGNLVANKFKPLKWK